MNNLPEEALYTIRFKDGVGFNQVNARTEVEAIVNLSLKLGEFYDEVDLDTLHRCTPEEEKAYWDNLPLFD